MKLAIMQPYLFPYVGYFQLVRAVDRFVFYDDVNYIKAGWINRNRLLLSGKVGWFTLPVSSASQWKKINELHVKTDGMWKHKLLSSVRQSYQKAPYFEQAYPLLANIILSEETSLAVLAQRSVVAVSRYLGLDTDFVVSTERYGNEALRGPDRIVDICVREEATEYHNLPGGESLYSEDQFSANGIKLHFIRPKLAEYKQLRGPFVPGLSTLDLLMFNDRTSSLLLLEGRSPP